MVSVISENPPSKTTLSCVYVNKRPSAWKTLVLSFINIFALKSSQPAFRETRQAVEKLKLQLVHASKSTRPKDIKTNMLPACHRYLKKHCYTITLVFVNKVILSVHLTSNTLSLMQWHSPLLMTLDTISQACSPCCHVCSSVWETFIFKLMQWYQGKTRCLGQYHA